jgi:hypothetical protein
MSKLMTQLQRLYGLPGQLDALLLPAQLVAGLAERSAVQLNLLSATQTVRTCVLAFKRSSDWPAVAALCQGLQDELALPLPALAIGGGYQLWFSLAEPIPLSQAQALMQALIGKYLAEVPGKHFACFPGDKANSKIELVPALQADQTRWSAFIDPTLGSMFTDEAWLDMAPSLDKQADMLAGLRSISLADLAEAMALLATPATPQPGMATAPVVPPPETLSLAGGYADPHGFLLAVMNDPTVAASHRIEAAKALLPYFDKV